MIVDGVVVKWKTAKSGGGVLSFEGGELKPMASVDATEALACFSPLDLGEAVYYVPNLDVGLLELKKNFNSELSAGCHDVPLSNLTSYEAQLGFPMSYHEVSRCLVGEHRSTGVHAQMYSSGDLHLRFKDTSISLRLGKTKFLAKNGKEQGKLLALYASDAAFLDAEFKKWSPLNKLIMAMRTRICEESFV